MERGAYCVYVTVESESGSGTVIVPVNAVALTRRPLEPWFAAVLLAAGAFLFLFVVAITAGAAREAVLPPGAVPGPRRRRWARAAGAAAALALGLSLFGGKRWWDAVDADYRNNTLYRPVPVSAVARAGGSQRILRLAVEGEERSRDWAPLVTDHGKLMHLFLVREPDLDALAHLHPIRRGKKVFEAALPPLPAGSYRLYADVTHENGFSQTLTAPLDLPEPPASTAPAVLASDPDDSYFIGAPPRPPAAGESGRTDSVPPEADRCSLEGGLTMTWDRAAPIRAGREASLSFRVLEGGGAPAVLEPYMGMLGHAAVRRDDGAVFAHLHPVGTISMASQELFLRLESERGAKSGRREAGSGKGGHGDPAAHQGHDMAPAGGAAGGGAISFPYEFPRPGSYHLWVQIKTGGRVLTGVFAATVGD
jgi:hypothetical protein